MQIVSGFCELRIAPDHTERPSRRCAELWSHLICERCIASLHELTGKPGKIVPLAWLYQGVA